MSSSKSNGLQMSFLRSKLLRDSLHINKLHAISWRKLKNKDSTYNQSSITQLTNKVNVRMRRLFKDLVRFAGVQWWGNTMIRIHLNEGTKVRISQKLRKNFQTFLNDFLARIWSLITLGKSKMRLNIVFVGSLIYIFRWTCTKNTSIKDQ